jgi:hypothetical protein
MSRDLLLACLALALVLNLALLGQAASLYFRRGRAAARTRERAATPARAAVMIELPHARPIEPTPASNGAEHLPVAEQRLPVAEQHLPVAEQHLPVADQQLPVAQTIPGTEVVAVAPSPPTDGRAGEPAATGTAAELTRAPASRAIDDGLPRPRAVASQPRPKAIDANRGGNGHANENRDGNGNANADLRHGTAAKAASKRTPRGRRFVLPPLDEDQARSARAIEAFLDGPPPAADTAPERPARRRHRVRRAAGTPVPRTTMIVWLQGYSDLDRAVGSTRAATVSSAFVDALRRAARATDEVREMGSGRCRIVVDTDDAGATAFVERARRGVQPWLELLAVPLKVESGKRESSEIVQFGGTRRAVGDH